MPGGTKSVTFAAQSETSPSRTRQIRTKENQHEHHSTFPAPRPPHADDELMTMKEVATLVLVPEATLRYWRHLGTGPHGFRVGRSVPTGETKLCTGLKNSPVIHRAAIEQCVTPVIRQIIRA
jgi:hypothetical protein